MQPPANFSGMDRNPDLVTVRVEYFAVFRSLSKASSEEITASPGNVLDLYESLREKYRFPLDIESVHAVVNEEYADWNRVLRSGDTVVFMPPISGG